MKKVILTSLIILLGFSLWTVLAFGKAKRDEGIKQSTEVQKVEPILAPEDFPEVVLPRPRPYRPTMDDFQREVLDHKGWSLEQIEERKVEPVPLEFEPALEKAPYYCEVRNQLGGIYYRPGSVEWLHCWGQIGTATFLDLDNNYWTDCPYPLYPFHVTEVAVQLYYNTNDTCLFVSEARIYSADYSGGGPYPDQILCTSDSLNPQVDEHPGAFLWIVIPLEETCCLNEPFFAVWVFNNSDDFYDTVNCTPIYSGWLSWLFDASGRLYQSYWNPHGLDSIWYDVVQYGIAPGAIRVEVLGYTADQNTCPPPAEEWYFKESYADAPCGIPDFDQYQMSGPAYCGPASSANSFWWLWANPPENDLHIPIAPVDVPSLIDEISTAAQTDPNSGSECDKLYAGILEVIKAHGGWWYDHYFYENPDYEPNFWALQDLLKHSSEIVLLLGFWQQQPDSSWKRFGGHFVTLAGVDIFDPVFQIAISDPAIDNAEASMPGIVCHTDSFPHPGDSLVHNNPANASHDFYSVAWPSPSPGGYLWLPDYNLYWQDFQDQNFRTEHLSYAGTYNPAFSVIVEVEAAIRFSPGVKYWQSQIESSHAYEEDNNYGGIAKYFMVDFAGIGDYIYGGYDGSFICGTSQANLNCSYGAYHPAKSFEPLAAPVWDTFMVTGAAGDYRIEQLTLKFGHSFIPDLEITEYVFGFWVPEGGAEECEYVFEHVFVLENKGTTDILGLQKALLLDYDVEDLNNNMMDFDQHHQSMWMYDGADPSINFGITKKPIVEGAVAITGYGLSCPERIYDNQYLDSLKIWMENLGWGVDKPGVFEDKSILMADSSFNLSAGEIHIENWVKWGYGDTISAGGDTNWRHFLYNVLHQEGFYRGDINKDGWLTVGDVVYLINYLFKGGPAPIEFESQADVNCDDATSVSDVVYMMGFLFKFASAPIDKNRFLHNSPFVDPAHKALGIRRPGLFGDPDWKDLGK